MSLNPSKPSITMLRAVLFLGVVCAVAFGAKFREWISSETFPPNFYKNLIFPADQQEKCRIEDSSCLVRVINDIVKKSRQPYPEMGLPVMDPLVIDKMNIDQGGSGSVTLHLSLKDTLVKGFANTQVKAVEGFKENFNKTRIEFRFRVPVMLIAGPYKMNGRILVLPVQGNGMANITLSKLRVIKFSMSFVLMKVCVCSWCWKQNEADGETSAKTRQTIHWDWKVKIVVRCWQVSTAYLVLPWRLKVSFLQLQSELWWVVQWK